MPAVLLLPVIVAYFGDNYREAAMGARRSRPLDEYPPGILEVTDPDGLCEHDRTDIVPYYFQTGTLELRSALARHAARGHEFVRGRGPSLAAASSLPPEA